MFDTLLVANRGEIACRIIRSAHALGLRTVAVYSDADGAAPHVRMADEAVRLGPAPAAESYLRADLLLEAALATGAGAVHPGYGFLSESAAFATAVEEAGLVFVGPAPAQLEVFGAKHTARTAARAAGVPLLPGSGLLADEDEALRAAEETGYPVMLKATGGGGGIGMRVCAGPETLREAFGRVTRLARSSFGDGGVYLERYVDRARHVEVQVFGDGAGGVVVLGDRDCSLQRRNQKVLEEAPAPGLPQRLRSRLHSAARDLCASVGYRSAGTVEFVYDAEREEAYFLEVNTRLQVEHPVTEEITGVDLVAWMLRLARGESGFPASAPLGAAENSKGSKGSEGSGTRHAHAVEARIYAEDPSRDHRPSSGLLTRVRFPDGVRVDGWAETGQQVSTAYDPMLAKVVATGRDRAEAFARLAAALDETRVDGVETNLGLLRAACRTEDVLEVRHTTATLAGIVDPRPRVDVVRGGTQTTVQDWPGRTGYWEVGVPPGGPMDDLSFRLGNTAVGNPVGAPGLECTLEGPALRFSHPVVVCVTGAPAEVTVDGRPAAQWQPVELAAGQLLDVGTPKGPGMRTYVLVRGGLDVPGHLGSAATFTLGGFGGHAGRALRTGDVLHPAGPAADAPAPAPVPVPDRPHFTAHWRVAVSEGPHPAPDFLTRDGLRTVYAADWKVSAQSARTGVRLIGPRPEWARPDGGEAGLHPSNVHDTAYSVGAVNLTGDIPAILGPDGPSLGGFACPVTVVRGERWKTGQLRPGDTVRFVPVTEAVADGLRRTPALLTAAGGPDGDDGVLARRPATDNAPEVTYRRGADDNILVEYGPMTLDLALRMRVHALARHLAALAPRGLVDSTPGVRSLHLHTDPDVLPLRTLLAILREAEDELPATAGLTVPSREVHLPMSWDDPTVDEAVSRYGASIRDDAPWNPSNIDFIRRINGLDSVEDVRRTVFDAEYLVLGLGDVYLGAPAATPLDPRHRLVTTKYNPARTWTAEAGVGIGGAYLCIYGMESPGGYQLIGRTVPIWGGLRPPRSFADGTPWLLRFFDRIVWHPVEAGELLGIRADLAAGRSGLDIRPGTFSLAEHEAFLRDNAAGITAFRSRQAAAFEAERRAWEAAGEFADRPLPEPGADTAPVALPPGGSLVEAPLSSTVWKVEAGPGTTVEPGQPLLVLEAMKMEVVIRAPGHGIVTDVLVSTGQHIDAGTPLAVVVREEAA
ncbi:MULTISPECIES: urea carboxylase [unclassified Streptomyces]|uniref:urea carboxylase n=1 Tax=unclassified Streptomyces TaxID=2593676 RepID=UPI0005AA4D22|nr:MULTISPECIES: urea carboxylase [unclassified Streptomyces]ODA72857.1 Acetyl-/propionyl-coenzyme A carboxylase alpha chain [Streptomyces sp. AVP053U2]